MNTVGRIEPNLNGVFWATCCKEPPLNSPALSEDINVDLAVVGGGYCGLAIAMAAAPHVNVGLFEAGTIGCGASGRNSGFVVPQFPGAITPDVVEDMLGPKKGQALCELVTTGAERVMDRIRRHKIDCDVVQNGWMQPAHSPAALEKVRRVHDSWRARGASIEWLDATDVEASLGAPGYLGGWRHPSGMQVNPLALTRGLARTAASMGVQIFEGSAVNALTSDQAGSILAVNGYRVQARRVVFATNGYTAPIVSTEHRSVIPVQLFDVVTKPLTDQEHRSVLPSDSCFTDLRRSGGGARFVEGGRLLTGGLVFAPLPNRAYGVAHVRRRLRELFPQLKRIEADAYWDGWCAVTDSFLPRVEILASEVFSIGGFSTRGLALSLNTGEALGEFVAGNRDLEDLPLEVVNGARPAAFQQAKELGARLIYPYYQALDRFGLS